MAATPNYTPELTNKIVDDYENGIDVEQIAEAIGKSVRSVRSKLVREGVYKAPEKPVKEKVDTGPTKKEMMRELETLVDFPVDGFMGATKAAIQSLLDAFSVEVEDEPETD